MIYFQVIINFVGCAPLTGPSLPCSYGSWIYNFLCN